MPPRWPPASEPAAKIVLRLDKATCGIDELVGSARLEWGEKVAGVCVAVADDRTSRVEGVATAGGEVEG